MMNIDICDIGKEANTHTGGIPNIQVLNIMQNNDDNKGKCTSFDYKLYHVITQNLCTQLQLNIALN